MNPALYCVHLPSSVARAERMKRRFRHHGFDRARLVPAIELSHPREDSDEWKAMAGRHTTASHVKCMRLLLEEVPESEGGAIICEDDALLHNRIGELLPDALANLPEDAGLLMLGFMTVGWPEGLLWSGRDPVRHNLVPVLPWETWGAHGYWITHEYARELVERLGDIAVEDLSNIVEEQITFPSNGFAAYPPLMLQETVDSVVRPEHELPGHVEMQAAWPYRDYSEAEEEPAISPLAALPDPTRTIGLSVNMKHPADPVARLHRMLEGLISEGETDYVLSLDSDMAIDWRGPLPPLRADTYRIPVAGSAPTPAISRRQGGLGDEVPELTALAITCGLRLEDLVDAAFAIVPGDSLGLEGVHLGRVDLGGGIALEIEGETGGPHRLLKRDASGAIVGSSPEFSFSGSSLEDATGVAVADGKLIIGFRVDDHNAGLAACDLEDALTLITALR